MASAISKPNHSCQRPQSTCVSPSKTRATSHCEASNVAPRYHCNQQYSVIALTTGGGTVTERYAYSAYGTPTITDGAGTTLTTSAENNRYTYTGREYDEALGLYHYRARMYDSVAGRFCSRDPIGFQGSPWLLYEFLNSSPTTFLDSDGNFAFAIPLIPAGIGIAALQWAAVASGVTLYACLLMPECLGKAKDRALDKIDDKIDDLWPWNPKPKYEPAPKPKPIPVPWPFPPGGGKKDCDDGDNDRNCCLKRKPDGSPDERPVNPRNPGWKICAYKCEKAGAFEVTLVVPKHWDCPDENEHQVLPKGPANPNPGDPPLTSNPLPGHPPFTGPSPFPSAPLCD